MKLQLSIVPIVLLLLLGSCKKEGSETALQKETLYRVGFSCSNLPTKGIAPINGGIVAAMHCFGSGDNPLLKREWPGVPPLFKIESCGSVVPLDNSQLLLPQGVYSFYLLSTNGEEFNEPYNWGEYRVFNGRDYLFASTSPIYLTREQRVPLTFYHLSTAIAIQFVLKSEEESTPTLHASLRLPLSPSSFQLSSSFIEEAIGLEEHFTPFKLIENHLSTIILPLTKGVVPKLKVELQSEAPLPLLSKEIDLPAPDNHFKGGRRYRYLVEVSRKAINFAGATVEEWSEEQIEALSLQEI